ncbi:TolC family protein [Exilibacterium tricleocarpae]|uniref:TolC family protein n=1 Tax=Exilibacterium tricleocarpae TaxID=2591008 RepID=A0A545TFJ7_9GAMM|nr:TolC family protein [Exilibacterium tricleocarpae]TQV75951.1 TolC family protein [Exilibacterium tricleocarpae]
MRAEIPYLKWLVCVCLSVVSPLSRPESLGQLIKLALDSHPEVQASRILRDASGADIDYARWQFFPSFTVRAQGTSAPDDDPSYEGDDQVSSVGLVQPIWTGGAVTGRLKSAKANFNLRESEINQAEQGLAIRVLVSYVDWYSANRRVAAWQTSLLVHQNLSKQVRRRTSNGASSESDLALAEARVALTEADLAATIAEEQTALAVLAELVGKPIDSSDLVNEYPKPKQIDIGLEMLKERAWNNSPSAAAAVAEVGIADADILSARATYMPKINLRLERQYGNFAYDDTSPSDRIFIEFTTEFGAGLSSRSIVSAARLRREAALVNIERQRQLLDSNIVSDKLLQVSVARRLTALMQSKQATQDVYESFERQFLSGSRTWLDLLNAARELTQVELQIADARASSVLVSWRLYILTQGVDSVLGES